jgi:hypothetical protein
MKREREKNSDQQIEERIEERIEEKTKERKLDQQIKERIERIKLKKIVFGNSVAYALDKHDDLYEFDANKYALVENNVKDISGSGDHIFGTSAYLFKLKEGRIMSCVGSHLQFEKIFVFPGTIFGNTDREKTWIIRYAKDKGGNDKILTQEKCLGYLKKVIQRSFTKENQVYDIFIGITHDKTIIYDKTRRFSIFYTKDEVCSIESIREEQVIRLLSNQFKEQEINDMIAELSNEELSNGEEKKFTIDCSGEKIEVKMIHNTSDFSAAVDKDGMVYFGGKDKYKFIYTENKSDEWVTSWYYLGGEESENKMKRLEKLCNLLQK